MIIGIGVDIVKVKRIKKALERTAGFCKGVFSLEEIAYFSNKNNKYETAAGFFAAKEDEKAKHVKRLKATIFENRFIKDSLKNSASAADNFLQEALWRLPAKQKTIDIFTKKITSQQKLETHYNAKTPGWNLVMNCLK